MDKDQMNKCDWDQCPGYEFDRELIYQRKEEKMHLVCLMRKISQEEIIKKLGKNMNKENENIPEEKFNEILSSYEDEFEKLYKKYAYNDEDQLVADISLVTIGFLIWRLIENDFNNSEISELVKQATIHAINLQTIERVNRKDKNENIRTN